MNKECELIQESLSAYQDGELAREQLKVLHDHLSTCLDCQALLEDYTRVGHLLREQMARQMTDVNLAPLKEKVLKQITSPARSGPADRVALDIRKYRWPLVWVLGVAMAIVLIWLGPQLLEMRDHPGPAVFNGSAQARLGLAIRDAAGIRFAVGQAADRYQEQLGRLIRDGSRGDLQEQLGLLIRDHAHFQWTLKRQRDQLEEQLGLLIQTQAREHQDS
jgi:predicted anti-sigma-YlaC factor YlaD